MLGAVAGLTKLVSQRALKKAILNSVPGGTVGTNIMALEKGFEYATTLESRS